MKKAVIFDWHFVLYDGMTLYPGALNLLENLQRNSIQIIILAPEQSHPKPQEILAGKNIKASEYNVTFNYQEKTKKFSEIQTNEKLDEADILFISHSDEYTNAAAQKAKIVVYCIPAEILSEEMSGANPQAREEFYKKIETELQLETIETHTQPQKNDIHPTTPQSTVPTQMPSHKRLKGALIGIGVTALIIGGIGAAIFFTGGLAAIPIIGALAAVAVKAVGVVGLTAIVGTAVAGVIGLSGLIGAKLGFKRSQAKTAENVKATTDVNKSTKTVISAVLPSIDPTKEQIGIKSNDESINQQSKSKENQKSLESELNELDINSLKMWADAHEKYQKGGLEAIQSLTCVKDILHNPHTASSAFYNSNKAKNLENALLIIGKGLADDNENAKKAVNLIEKLYRHEDYSIRKAIEIPIQTIKWLGLTAHQELKDGKSMADWLKEKYEIKQSIDITSSPSMKR
jgi:hypothetical protein